MSNDLLMTGQLTFRFVTSMVFASSTLAMVAHPGHGGHGLTAIEPTGLSVSLMAAAMVGWFVYRSHNRSNKRRAHRSSR